MIMHVNDAIEGLQDECDKVYERLADDVNLEADSFIRIFNCDSETANKSPKSYLYRLPLFSFQCVRTVVRHRTGLPSVVVYTVTVSKKANHVS